MNENMLFVWMKFTSSCVLGGAFASFIFNYQIDFSVPSFTCWFFFQLNVTFHILYLHCLDWSTKNVSSKKMQANIWFFMHDFYECLHESTPTNCYYLFMWIYSYRFVVLRLLIRAPASCECWMREFTAKLTANLDKAFNKHTNIQSICRKHHVNNYH